MAIPALHGPYLRVIDIEGHQHAIRCQAITALAEVGEDGRETLILVGRSVVRADHALEDILSHLVLPPRPVH